MEYDLAWLVALAKVQITDRPEVIESLERSTSALAVRQGYVQFVSSLNPNQPGSDWQFAENVILESTDGDIVLDVLRDGRIGGIEFTWLIPTD